MRLIFHPLPNGRGSEPGSALSRARQQAVGSSLGAMLLLAGLSTALAQGVADTSLDAKLQQVLKNAGFTGQAGVSLEHRLGRPVDPALANLGRLLFFDKILALHSDNSCSGCHTPEAGFGDTQSIAIGIQNNNVVGPGRQGPRNQRRTPMLVNDSFFPKLMWNGRFSARSGDPFDNSQGFHFPDPEGDTRFPPNDPNIRHLLVAQAHMPPTETTESAGFTGTKGTGDPAFDIFDDGQGSPLPPPDASGSRNEPIRMAVLARLNVSAAYRSQFGAVFPVVAQGQPITYVMAAQAIAEFQHTLVFADAPVDRFARGETTAMTARQKRGALVFFGAGQCVGCHAVGGQSNEMFSDFENHTIGVPQLGPRFGLGTGNVVFDGPATNEDFGAEQVSNDPADRYRFRTSPLRNVALQPAFFHDGAFTRLEDAIFHHLYTVESARLYRPSLAGVDRDLWYMGPMRSILDRLDPKIRAVPDLAYTDVLDLIAFVREGLLDGRTRPAKLCQLIPSAVPSGMPIQKFDGCIVSGQ